MTFENLHIIPPILEAIKKGGYTTPTPIQVQAIPVVLQGRDLIGCAQTGTGKTAAFAIPILQILSKCPPEQGRRAIKALILTPTRELAIQIGGKFVAYGRNLGLRHTTIYGGVRQGAQTKALQQGVDILVATPGRLMDLMGQGFVRLDHVRILTLDEADRMLDMGFINDVKKIIGKLPFKRQTLFFSATMPAPIVNLSRSILVNPIKIEVSPELRTAENIKQELYYVSKANKGSLLVHVLQKNAITSALVFTRTKHGANKVAKFVNDAGIRAEAIHGNKSQGARQHALESFKAKKTRVLVATDIASRGIDINNLSHVINFEIPNVPETYVHRIGRTGRAGLNGSALSFCDFDEKSYIRDIHNLIKGTIPVVEDHPYVLKNASFQGSTQGSGASHGGSGHGSSGYHSRSPYPRTSNGGKWFVRKRRSR